MAKKEKRQAETAGAEPEVMDPVPRVWEMEPELTDRREYPVEVREEFLRRVLEEGEHLSLVAREMGVPVGTVEHWIAEIKHERAPQLELENIRLVDRLGKVSYELLDGLDKNKIAKAGVKDLEVNAMLRANLTVKQEKYAQGLFKGLTQREAYKEAYDCKKMSDKCIDEEACKLAANPKITKRLDELNKEVQERNMATIDKVIAELAHIAFDDISNYLDFYEDEHGNVSIRIKDSKKIDTRSVSEVSQGKDGSFRFKMHSKDNALEKLGRVLGIFVDKKEIAGEVKISYEDVLSEIDD